MTRNHWNLSPPAGSRTISPPLTLSAIGHKCLFLSESNSYGLLTCHMSNIYMAGSQILKVSEDQNISIEIQFYQTNTHNRNVSTSPPCIGMCPHNTWIAQCSIFVKSSSRVICIDDFFQTEGTSSQHVDESHFGV